MAGCHNSPRGAFLLSKDKSMWLRLSVCTPNKFKDKKIHFRGLIFETFQFFFQGFVTNQFIPSVWIWNPKCVASFGCMPSNLHRLVFSCSLLRQREHGIGGQFLKVEPISSALIALMMNEASQPASEWKPRLIWVVGWWYSMWCAHRQARPVCMRECAHARRIHAAPGPPSIWRGV